MNTPDLLPRERERLELLRNIQSDIEREERFVGDFHLYRILNILFDTQLALKPAAVDEDEDLVFRLGVRGRRVLRLFRRLEKQISRFQASEEERRALFAELIVWSTSQIAHPHLETLKAKERRGAKPAPPKDSV